MPKFFRKFRIGNIHAFKIYIIDIRSVGVLIKLRAEKLKFVLCFRYVFYKGEDIRADSRTPMITPKRIYSYLQNKNLRRMPYCSIVFTASSSRTNASFMTKEGAARFKRA